MQYRKRALQAQIQEAMLDTSVIAITGARRSGKSTLIQQLIDHGFILYTGVHTVPLPTKITLLPKGQAWACSMFYAASKHLKVKLALKAGA